MFVCLYHSSHVLQTAMRSHRPGTAGTRRGGLPPPRVCPLPTGGICVWFQYVYIYIYVYTPRCRCGSPGGGRRRTLGAAPPPPLLHAAAQHLVGGDEHHADDEGDGEGADEALAHAGLPDLLAGAGWGESQGEEVGGHPNVPPCPVPRVIPVVSGLRGGGGVTRHPRPPRHSLSTSTGHSSAVPMWLSSSVMMMFSMSFMERCSQKVSYSSRFSSSTVSFCMSHCGERAGSGGAPAGADPMVRGSTSDAVGSPGTLGCSGDGFPPIFDGERVGVLLTPWQSGAGGSQEGQPVGAVTPSATLCHGGDRNASCWSDPDMT